MMAQTRLTRRTFLGATVAGAAALALPRTALASSTQSPIALEFWNPATDAIGKKLIAGMVKTFNDTIGKTHGIVVHDRAVADDNYAVKYTTAMSASSGSPDVVMTYSYALIPPWAANGFIQPIDAYAGAAGIKQSDYFPVAWDMLHIDGHFWGMLQEFDFNQFYINRTIHHGEPPKTIAELDALAARYTVFDKKGNLTQAGLIPWAGAGGGGYTEWSALWGASFYDHARGKWTIDTPHNRRFLDWMLKYVHMVGGRSKSDALISSTQAGFGGDAFQAGKMAFAVEGEWTPPAWKLQTPKLKYSIAHAPTTPGVPYGTVATAGGNTIALPTRSPHPKEAALFISYMGAASAVRLWNIQEGNIPPVKSVAFSAAFLKALPYMAPYIAALKLDHIVPPFPSPVFPTFDNEMNNAVDEVTFKRMTPAQALAAVAQKVATAEEQFKQSHPSWPTE